MDIQPHAYNVWICGRCELHTVDTDGGGHLCETCGQLYDHAGHPLSDDDDVDPGSVPEYRDEGFSLEYRGRGFLPRREVPGER